MAAWWLTLTVLQRVFFVIGCASTIFMIIQIIMMAVGGANDDPAFEAPDSADGDLPDSDSVNEGGPGGFTVFGLKILSVRSAVAFFAIGSWFAFSMEFIMRWYFAVPIGIVAGTLAGVLVAYFMKSVSKLQNSGNIDFKNCVGKIAEVYLTIPALKGGSGKISLTVQERLAEVEAITENSEPIKTGEKVKVVDVLDESTVIVEKI